MRYELIAFELPVLGMTHLDPGMGEVLQELSDLGATLAVIGALPEPQIRAVLDASQHLIDAYETPRGGSGAAGALRRIGRRMEETPGRTLFVSADPRSVDAAHRLGVPTAAAIWAGRGLAEPQAARPTWLLTQPVDLIAVVTGRPILRVVRLEP